MNIKTKRRLGVVTGVIVIVLIAVLAIVGGSTAARSVSVAEAVELPEGTKIRVSGNVVENSFNIQEDSITFAIYDPETDPAASTTMRVRFDGGVSSTFGNNVTAICTGKKDVSGTLNCTELVTKCPSKYESAEGALTADELLAYGESIVDKPVKIIGVIEEDTLSGIDADSRFTLVDSDSGRSLRVLYDGAIPDDVEPGSTVILTGSLCEDGTAFAATDVALNG